MAKGDETEEKSLPPSRVKLDRLRREGQVARSRDLPVAAAVTAVVLLLSWSFVPTARTIASALDAVLSAPELGSAGRGAAGSAAAAVGQAGWALLGIVAPPMAVGAAVAILASIVDAQGFPVSMKHMSFDGSRLNPAEGLKKIVSLASFSEFLKGLVKLLLLAVAGGGAVAYFLNAIFWSPLCGPACTLGTTTRLMVTLAVISILILLLAALVDIRISRALFRREHRMTKTEARREHKEMQGDPHMKSEWRRLASEMRSTPPKKAKPPR